MSRSADRRPRPRDDAGFALVEVMVALGIIALVATALLPQLLVGIKSTDTARLVTEAKGVAQGQVERMRNLPYHVATDSGDYRDVLDYYFRNGTAPLMAPTCKDGDSYRVPEESWSGYVASDNSARCDYEPQSGAMYRAVKTGTDGFTAVVSTQFLSGDTPPVVVIPPSGYDTQASGHDTPASMQIGVVVTVLYADRQTTRPVSTYTRIADQPGAPQQLQVTADATALQVGSVTPTEGAVSLDAGLLHLDGSLTYASTADVTLAATSAGLATGTPAGGASTTLAVPPTIAASPATQPAGDLTVGCALVCWDASRIDVGAATAADGLPNLGSSSSPMQALLTDRTNGGVSFDNGPADKRRPGLVLHGHLVTLDDTGATHSSGLTTACGPGAGTSSYVTASGFVRTTATEDLLAPSVVEGCALARTTTVSLFPTTFAPHGVVRIELQVASAHCVVSGVGHTPAVSYDYGAIVSRHLPGGTGDDYAEAAVITPSPTQTTDPLDDVDLGADVGGDRTLGDYIASWSSLQQSEVESTSTTGLASLRLPGVVTLISQPVRTGTVPLDGDTGPLVDPLSALSLTLGSSSCSARDAR